VLKNVLYGLFDNDKKPSKRKEKKKTTIITPIINIIVERKRPV